MQEMRRFAVYYAPRPGPFADRASEWLGWDPVVGTVRRQPEGVPVIERLTAAPAKYGFHGTLRAPFRPADGVTRAAISETVAAIASDLPPVDLGELRLAEIGGFLALVPADEAPLQEFAATVVLQTNDLRAPLTADEIAKRNPARLSTRQRELLDLYGYPYVFEEFRFHLTLTDRLPLEETGGVTEAILTHFGDTVPVPFVIEDLCLFGEDAAGRFHLLERYALTV